MADRVGIVCGRQEQPTGHQRREKTPAETVEHVDDGGVEDRSRCVLVSNHRRQFPLGLA